MNRRNTSQLVPAMIGAILLATPAFAQPVPVHEYRFAGNGNDSTGTADGSVGSNLSFTAAGVPNGLGQALVVGTNGTAPNNVIAVPNPDFVDFGMADFSLAFWVRRDNSDASIDGVFDALAGTGRGWEVYFQSTDVLTVRLDDNSANTAEFDTAAPFTDAAWHHVLISVDRDQINGLAIYIDGLLDSSHDPTSISANIDPNQALWIGGRNDAGAQGLEGELALLQVYTEALTADDAARLAAIGFPIHQYDFEGDGLDIAGSADGAVGVNVTFNSVGVPVELGQAAVFGNDGSIADNRIDVPLASFTDFGLGDFSVSIWVKRDQNSGASQGLIDNLGSNGTQIQFLSNDILRARIDDNLGNEFRPESLTTITDLGWHHLLMTIDRDAVDGAKWYIDGQLDSSDDPTVLTGSILANQDLYIGTINSFGLRGQLANLAFFNRALTTGDAVRLADLDGDGVPYVVDACRGFDDNLDADADTVPDDCDICPGFDDALDADFDTVPDGCDICPGFDDNLDADTDGVPDGCDLCPGFDDTLDADGDGVPDDCDVCTGSSETDSDGDGICDEFDACAGDDALCTVPANVICVWAVAPGAQDGSNWFNAYRDLKSAIAISSPGDEIWVAAGTYYPDGGYQPSGGSLIAGTGNRDQSFVLASDVALYGGFAGYESLRAQRDPQANVVTLSGDIDGDQTPAGNSYRVVEVGTNASDCELNGFTVTAGNANGSGANTGGGMYVNGSTTVVDCAFINNTSTNIGGGVRLQASATGIFEGCRFLGNYSNDEGGGVACHGNMRLVQCVFSGNVARRHGGGLYAAAGDISLVQCTFNANTAQQNEGGGIRSTASSRISNCILWGNTDSGPMDESAQISDFGASVVRHSVVQGGWSGLGENNLNADPLFTDADGADDIAGTADDDLTLVTGSPCIDTGDNAAVPIGLITDFAGTPRFNNCLVDMGPFEFAGAAPIDTDADGFTDACDACPGGDDRVDLDSDNVADDCDPCVGTAASDTDNDGICDDMDACAGDDALCPGQPNVIHVWPAAPGAETGSNWYHAFHDLKSALLAASPGDEVWVARGTYYPDGGFLVKSDNYMLGTGDRQESFELESGVAIFGGFVGNESNRAQRDWTANPTILSGNITASGSGAGTSHHVVTGGVEDDETAVLDGFTVTLGSAESAPTSEGGGMLNAGSPTVANCVFSQNRAILGGGLANSGSPLITQCVFIANWSSLGGDALYNTGAGAVTNCLFTFPNGGNSLVRSDTALTSLTMTNCVLWSANQFSLPISDMGKAMVVNHSVVLGGWTGLGANNIDVDPLFVNEFGPDGIAGTGDEDFSLQAGSPCIDAGDNNAVPAGLFTDLAGDIRRVDDPATPDTGIGLCAIVDMGPYEFQDGAGEADSDADGVCDSVDACPGFDDNLDTDADGLPDDCDACPTIATGDVNADTFVELGDLAPFVAVLLDPGSATPDELCAADTNNDAAADGLDVQGLIDLILSP
ncbi:MAG: hypothetical protein HS101_01535 [Planctomycetia bacterium]|nr:hypothetical protein [Planctomycetia bacterium]MCC7314765.1 hypothetical protein [Planctomycetota bacterium]